MVPRPSASAASRALAKQGQVDAEAAIGRLRPGDRLEHQIDRRPRFERLELGRDMGQHGALCRDIEAPAQLVYQAHQIGHALDRIAGRVDADHGIAGAVGETVQNRGRDARRIVGRMIRLQSGRESASEPDRAPEPGDHFDLAGDQHEILQPHDLGDRRRHFRQQPGRQRRKRRSIRHLRQQPVAERADSQTGDRREGRRVPPVEQQPRHLVGLVGDDRLVEESGERQVGERHLRRHPLACRAGGDAGQDIARAQRRRARQQRPQIGEPPDRAIDRRVCRRHTGFLFSDAPQHAVSTSVGKEPAATISHSAFRRRRPSLFCKYERRTLRRESSVRNFAARCRSRPTARATTPASHFANRTSTLPRARDSRA